MYVHEWVCENIYFLLSCSHGADIGDFPRRPEMTMMKMPRTTAKMAATTMKVKMRMM